METPLIIVSQDDLLFFRSVEDATRYLEPIDVEHGEYRAYDASGAVLQLGVATEERPMLFGLSHTRAKKVEITVEESPRRAEELRGHLVAYLVRLGQPMSATLSRPLHELIADAARCSGFTE